MARVNKPSVVIDTNLLISALISKGNSSPYKIVKAWRNDRFFLVVSEDIIDEVRNVFRRDKIYKKYKILQDEREEFIAELKNSTNPVKSVRITKLPIHSRDRKDDILLACALAGNCDYLITGDEDLLVLNRREELGTLKIIKAAEFLNILSNSE